MRRFTTDTFVSSLTFPQIHIDKFSKHMSSLIDTCSVSCIEQTQSDVEILKVVYMSKKSAPIVGQDWKRSVVYSYPKTSCHSMSSNDYAFLKKTYQHLYPDLKESISCMPNSFRRCSVVFLGKEAFGSAQSRHKRSSYVMAYWHCIDGKILNDVGSGVLIPGIIQYFILHNLIVADESRVHLFAKVLWLMPLPNMYKFHCGKPVEIWNRDLFDTFGESAFIPVQRIHCKYIRADCKLYNKRVSYICPLNNGINV